LVTNSCPIVARGEARAFPMQGYWRDVGTLQSYWEGNMDSLHSAQAMRLNDSDWPILTASEMRLPACITPGATVENSLLSPGCIIEGTVINSVLSPGSVVEAGAEVRDSVLFEESRIKSGARLSRAIVDARMLALGEHTGNGDDIAVIAR
jgi:glucose-1-phosphate adenylyltransferase